jgi:hypothetical protein
MAYIDFEQFSDDVLVGEVKSRGYEVTEWDTFPSGDFDQDLEQIYLLRRLGLPYDHLMDSYIYKVLGKVV